MARKTPRARAAEWASTTAVREVFETLHAETMVHKRDHVMELPPELSKDQAAVLEANLGRLPLGRADKIIGKRSAEILEGLCRGQGEGEGGEVSPWRAAWRGYERVLGLPAGGCDPNEAAAQFRHCVIAQAIAVDPEAWPGPAHSLLYAGIWHALHAGLGEAATRPEPMINEELLTQVKISFRHRIIEPLVRDGVGLPRPFRLKIAVASMQDGHDHLGSDLAVVVGTRVQGREMYRVIVFQAKKLTANGCVDIGSKDSGKQLDKLLSTGMGWYLFYPTPEKGISFIATARPATEIFENVWGDKNGPRYIGPFANGAPGAWAWDLPTFICVRMASDDISLGRLFPDADSVAAALSTERTIPLVPRVLAVDLTGALNLGKFVANLKSAGYRTDGVHSITGDADAGVRPDGEDPPSSPGRRRRN